MSKRAVRISCAAAAAAGGFMGTAWHLFEAAVHCKRKSPDVKAASDKKEKNHSEKKKWPGSSQMQINHPRHKFEQEYEEGKAWCREQKMQDCYVKSVDGLVLHASYLPAEDAQRYVLLSHGYKGSGFGDFAYTARFLHENQCNLLFIDQRCCGESQGEFITFGAKEQYDVQRWAYYLARRNQKRLPIYLYGESMGAAAVLMASGQNLPRDVRGLIADCGFHSMKGQLQDMAANWFHLHWIPLLLLRVDWFCRLLADFRMKDADTARAMKENTRPVLFFHGLKDTYVDPRNTRYHYSVCRAPKEMVLVPEARHLCSAYENSELYRGKLLEFFEKNDIFVEKDVSGRS